MTDSCEAHNGRVGDAEALVVKNIENGTLLSLDSNDRIRADLGLFENIEIGTSGTPFLKYHLYEIDAQKNIAAFNQCNADRVMADPHHPKVTIDKITQ